MKKQICLAAVTLACLPLLAQADATSMLLMEGKCSNVLIEGKSNNSCAGVFANSVFESDEVLFAFTLSKNGNISMLKFYGDGKREVSKGVNDKIQPITTVEYVTQQKRMSYAASGQCKYQNPYMGIPATVECTADTESGIMKAKFVTNGKEPVGG